LGKVHPRHEEQQERSSLLTRRSSERLVGHDERILTWHIGVVEITVSFSEPSLEPLPPVVIRAAASVPIPSVGGVACVGVIRGTAIAISSPIVPVAPVVVTILASESLMEVAVRTPRV
jgi:hypothetical protein